MLIISDTLQITNPQIAHAVTERDPGPIRKFVSAAVKAGADFIDINSGPLSKDPVEAMRFMVETVQVVTDLPVLIDTANPIAMEAGLAVNCHQAFINSFSLEPIKLAQILPLAVKYDVDIIGYLLTPDGHVPALLEDRIAVALELYQQVQLAGLDEKRLIIDPIVAPVVWEDGNQRNQDLLTLLQTLPEVLGFPVRTIAGLSNLTTGRGSKKQKPVLEQAFLAMMAAAGLDMVLLNTDRTQTVATAKACRLLQSNKTFAWEDLD